MEHEELAVVRGFRINSDFINYFTRVSLLGAAASASAPPDDCSRTAAVCLGMGSNLIHKRVPRQQFVVDKDGRVKPKKCWGLVNATLIPRAKECECHSD